jgi:glycosyltransferase involved in cell wall biosynthesis
LSDPLFVSVVLSFRNEEGNLRELLRRLRAAFDAAGVAHEMVFVNDSSDDGSLDILTREAASDPRIRVLTTSRRWGVYECLFEGLRRTRGDAVVYLDSDLQDPPELIPTMVARWQEGADIVMTVRRRRLGESAFKMWVTRLGYRIIQSVVYEIDFPVNAGDFRLMSRRVVDRLIELPEMTPYFRGLVNWIGFRQVTLEYDRDARTAGEPKFPVLRHFFRDLATLRGPVGTLVRGVTSFSLLPLLLFLPFGVLTMALSVLALIGGLIRVSAGHAGTAWWIVGALGALAGLQLIGFGVMGIYLARVFDEVRGRPRAIIDEARSLNI